MTVEHPRDFHLRADSDVVLEEDPAWERRVRRVERGVAGQRPRWETQVRRGTIVT
jgi:hypothetical protein